MIRQKVKVTNPSGLHLRPAGDLCKEALRYTAKIHFSIGDTRANAKSVLSVLGACVKERDEIEIECNGSDEVEAMNGIVRLIESGFGERE